MRPVVILLASCVWAAVPVSAQDQIVARVKEERVAEKDAGREGLQMVKRSLTLGNAAFRYQQLVDPAQQDKPVVQRYGDYALGCDFPRGSWNWDLEYFLNVTVARPGDKPFVANRALLQESITILQQGRRGVADMVWPLPATATRPQPGRLAVRLVKLPDDPAWMTVRISIEGEPDTKLTQIELHSYPTVTSGPPERQRWAATLTRTMQMGKPAPLDPAQEWAVLMHNRFAHEEGGSLLVMDPDQVASADIGGVYPIAVRMTLKPLSAATFAMGYFWDTPYPQAIAAFMPEAPARLKRLRATDWSVPVDLARWQREQMEVAEVLALAGAAAGDRAARWQRLQADMAEVIAALQQPHPDPAVYRRFVSLSRQAADLKTALYDPALQALIKQATQ